jgi:hypothetical protein
MYKLALIWICKIYFFLNYLLIVGSSFLFLFGYTVLLLVLLWWWWCWVTCIYVIYTEDVYCDCVNRKVRIFVCFAKPWYFVAVLSYIPTDLDPVNTVRLYKSISSCLFLAYLKLCSAKWLDNKWIMNWKKMRNEATLAKFAVLHLPSGSPMKTLRTPSPLPTI